MSMTAAAPLIEASDLARRLDAHNTIVVDCRFRLTEPEAGALAYRQAHIPGARYADLDRDLARQATPLEGRHPLPEPADFIATLGSWGIEADSHVTVYDDAGGAVAARLWWMLHRWLGHQRVAVLNGGLKAWLEAGFELEAGTVASRRADYAARPPSDAAKIETHELQAALQSGALLLDARADARFRGQHEPIDPVAGHIPGAINLPFDRCLQADGRFLAAQQLRDLFLATLGEASAKRCIAMCGSGVTACHLLLGMRAAGLDGGRLYVGSWSEWIRDPARPVATGD